MYSPARRYSTTRAADALQRRRRDNAVYMQPKVGEIFEAKVTGVMKFGAFVALPGGGSGLVHISEVANSFVSDIHEHITDGQTVKVKVIGIGEGGKVSLSIKKALTVESAAPSVGETGQRAIVTAQAREGYAPAHSGDAAFEDKLKRFMQDAESRMSENHAYINKKSGYRHKKA